MASTIIPCSYGSVSFAKSARLGISVDRKDLTVNQIDKLACGRRLTGKIVAVPNGEAPDQGKLEGFDEKVEMDGLFDVKRIGFTTDEISFGLTFALKGLDRETLAMFCNRTGKLTIKDSEPIPGDDDEEEEGDEEGAEEKE